MSKKSKTQEGVVYTSKREDTKYDDTLLCACTGTKCDGICRSVNLYRKRTTLPRCPSAYDPEKEPKRQSKRPKFQSEEKSGRKPDRRTTIARYFDGE